MWRHRKGGTRSAGRVGMWRHVKGGMRSAGRGGVMWHHGKGGTRSAGRGGVWHHRKGGTRSGGLGGVWHHGKGGTRSEWRTRWSVASREAQFIPRPSYVLRSPHAKSRSVPTAHDSLILFETGTWP